MPKLKPKPKAKPKPTRKQKQKHSQRIGHALNGTELLSNNIEYHYHDEPNSGREHPEESDAEEEQAEDEDDSDDDDYDDRIRAEIYSNYPHYLHPPSWGINNPLVLASHSPHTSEDDDVVVDVPTTTTHHSHKKPPQSPPPHTDDLERSVGDDVVVVVDTGPGPRPHTHTHPHTHTYYAHGMEPASTVGTIAAGIGSSGSGSGFSSTISPKYAVASVIRPGRAKVGIFKPPTLFKLSSHMIARVGSACWLLPRSPLGGSSLSLTQPKTLLATSTGLQLKTLCSKAFKIIDSLGYTTISG